MRCVKCRKELQERPFNTCCGIIHRAEEEIEEVDYGNEYMEYETTYEPFNIEAYTVKAVKFLRTLDPHNYVPIIIPKGFSYIR